MNRREREQAIYLSGIKPNYRVHHNVPGEAIVCYVAQADIGHTIVRALRERAAAKASTVSAPKREGLK